MIRDNIRLTTAAMKTRLGIDAGRLPHARRLRQRPADRPDVQQMLRTGLRPGSAACTRRTPIGHVGKEPGDDVFDAIVAAQADGAAVCLPDGLVEVPMSPISDIGAFRNGRWRLESFLEGDPPRRRSGPSTTGAVFDFLGHPSCLYVTDPEFRTID